MEKFQILVKSNIKKKEKTLDNNKSGADEINSSDTDIGELVQEDVIVIPRIPLNIKVPREILDILKIIYD